MPIVETLRIDRGDHFEVHWEDQAAGSSGVHAEWKPGTAGDNARRLEAKIDGAITRLETIAVGTGFASNTQRDTAIRDLAGTLAQLARLARARLDTAGVGA